MSDNSDLTHNHAMLEIEKDMLDDSMISNGLEEGASVNSNIVTQLIKILEKRKENIGKPGFKEVPENGFSLFVRVRTG